MISDRDGTLIENIEFFGRDADWKTQLRLNYEVVRFLNFIQKKYKKSVENINEKLKNTCIYCLFNWLIYIYLYINPTFESELLCMLLQNCQAKYYIFYQLS